MGWKAGRLGQGAQCWNSWCQKRFCSGEGVAEMEKRGKVFGDGVKGQRARVWDGWMVKTT